MIATLLAAFLAIQGAPLAAQQGGTITGVLKDAEGRPAVGARVSALARPESQLEALTGAALASIAATDEQGRYKLEEIPPGQYYIIAGRVDLPTYYPGTSEMSAGTLVKVAAGAALAGLDFSISDRSIRTEATDTFQVAVGRRAVATRVIAEGGGRIPVSSATGPVMLEFERLADGTVTTAPVTATSAVVEYLLAANATEFRLTVKNLPEGHVVSTIMSGSTDITRDTLKIPGTLNRSAGSQAVPPLTVSLTTTPVPASNASGIRVTGVGRPGDTHPIYLSGTPGIVFSDGTFEFRGVPSGRHTIATIDVAGRARGATVVVGNEDLTNVALTDVSTLPLDIQTPAVPGPTGNRPAGSTFAPVTLRFRVVEEKSKQPPPPGGQIYVNDRSGSAYTLDAEGKFAIPNLLPGSYNIEILMFGYSTVNHEITVGVEDMSMELTSQKLY